MAGVARIAALLGLLVFSVGMASPASASAPAGRPRPGVMERIEAAPRVPDGARAAGAVPASAAVSGRSGAEAPGQRRADAVHRGGDGHAAHRCSTSTCQPGPSRAGSVPRGRRSAPCASQLKADGLRVSGRVERRPAGALHRDRQAGRGRLPHRAGELPAARTARPGTATTIRHRDAVRDRRLGRRGRRPGRPGAAAAGRVLRAPASDRGKIRPAARRRASAIRPARRRRARMPPRRPGQFGGLTDDQIAHAYGAFGLYGSGDLGAGQHIAIYELEPFLRSDIKTFDTCYFGASGGGEHAQPAARDPGRRRPAGRAGQRRGDPRRRGRLRDRAGGDDRRLRGPEPRHRRHRSTTRSTTTRRSSTRTTTRS